MTYPYTTKACNVLSMANKMAKSLDHSEITPLHLTAAILRDLGALGTLLSKDMSRTRLRALEWATKELQQLSKDGEPPKPSQDLGLVIAQAQFEADAMGDSFVCCGHLFLALLYVESDASDLLRLFGVTRQAIVEAMHKEQGYS